MKDAQGHGSDSHSGGVDQVGKSFLPVIQSGGRDKNWYIQHGPSGMWLGQFMFAKSKTAEDFANKHLDPTNPLWRDRPESMRPVAEKATAAFNAMPQRSPKSKAR